MTDFFHLDDKKHKTRRLVAGLFWHPIAANTSRARKAEILEVADQMGMGAAIVRLGSTVQVGLSAKSEVGAWSAAAIVSKTIDVEGGLNDFVCATQIPDGRWLYVAQKDGVLLPDGDMVGIEDEVRSRMLADCSASNFGLVYAPEHWGIQSSGERDFLSFLPKKKGGVRWHAWWRLRPIRFAATDYIKKFIWVAVAVAVLAAGVNRFNHWEDGRKKEAAAIAAAIAAAAQPALEAVKPWAHLPRSAEVMRVCQGEFDDIRLSISGWRVSTVICSGANGLSVVWQAPALGRTHEDFLAQNPAAVISPDGSFATLTKALSFTSPEEAEELRPSPLLLAALADKTSRVGIVFKAQAASIPPPDPAGVAPDWEIFSWSVVSPVSPASLVPLIDVPGMRINQIMFSNNEWSIDGVIYAK